MKKLRPTSSGIRGTILPSYKGVVSNVPPHKSLTKGRKRAVGRNAFGRITTRHKGSGHKRLMRDVDFIYAKKDIPARVESIEYDPNRTGFIALIVFADGERKYILAPRSLKEGDAVLVSENAPIKPGNRLPLKNMPVGTLVYNVEFKPKNGAKIARSAGNFAELIAIDGGFGHLKMPSSEVRKVPDSAWASVGEVSNPENRLRKLGKAGRSRWMGIRPTVRGSAMNPTDHPHGGGEGRSGRGRRRAVSKWGKPTGKGQKSRRAKKYSDIFIVRRRKVGKKR